MGRGGIAPSKKKTPKETLKTSNVISGLREDAGMGERMVGGEEGALSPTFR